MLTLVDLVHAWVASELCRHATDAQLWCWYELECEGAHLPDQITGLEVVAELQARGIAVDI
jgi:hypothetical protein